MRERRRPNLFLKSIYILTHFHHNCHTPPCIVCQKAQPILGLANFGLYDQQEALRFLRRTSTPSPSPSSTSTAFIEAFGGDLNRLLLFGESAGAISVAMHLVSKPSEGLFTSALVESGFMSASNQDYALARGDNFTDAAGCAQGVPPRTPENRLKCLQAAPLKAILKAEGEVTPVGSDPFLVSAWGKLLLTIIITLHQPNQFNRVPCITLHPPNQFNRVPCITLHPPNRVPWWSALVECPPPHTQTQSVWPRAKAVSFLPSVRSSIYADVRSNS